MSAEWRPIPGYLGYEASKCGSIRSIDRAIETKSGVKKHLSDKVLKPGFHSKEFRYPQVSLGKNNGHKVHYLVAITWVGPRPGETYQVRHIDGNPENCAAYNLKWGACQWKAKRIVLFMEPPRLANFMVGQS